MVDLDPARSIAATVLAIRDGRLTAGQVARAALERLAALGNLNALVAVDGDDVLRQADALDRHAAAGDDRGALHGVPLVIKDNIHVEGMPNAAGTPALVGFRPVRDAAVVERLKAAGAVILGKSSMHELAMGWTGQSEHADVTRNPYDDSRMAGGSSGGTAAAIGAGIVSGGLGTDTNGSIRIPAGFCGVAGLRPTHGLLPLEGVTPLAPSLDTVGPMSSDVAGLALLHGVLSGEPGLGPQRVDSPVLGLMPAYFEIALSEATRAAYEISVDRLRTAGFGIIEIDMSGLAELVAGAVPATIAGENFAALQDYLARFHPAVGMEALVAGMGGDVRGALRPADGEMLEAHRAAQLRRACLAELFREVFVRHGLDALIHPTTPMPAPLLQAGALVSPAPDVEVDGSVLPARLAFAHNVSPASLAGLPSLTIPVPGAGLPIGLQLDGPAGSDSTLLALGQQVEAILRS